MLILCLCSAYPPRGIHFLLLVPTSHSAFSCVYKNQNFNHFKTHVDATKCAHQSEFAFYYLLHTVVLMFHHLPSVEEESRFTQVYIYLFPKVVIVDHKWKFPDLWHIDQSKDKTFWKNHSFFKFGLIHENMFWTPCKIGLWPFCWKWLELGLSIAQHSKAQTDDFCLYSD